MSRTKDPIYEGVLLKCADWNIDSRFVPTIYRLVVEKNPVIKRAKELIASGDMRV